MPDYGIDVASFNTIGNWAAVRGVGNAWMWSKATQGGGYTNPLFGAQISGARAAGLLVGAYHFPDPNVSVAMNVGHFRSVAAGQHALDAGCFVPMLDVEDDPADGIVWTPASANAFVGAFRDEFRAQTGVHELCVYGAESWFVTGKLDPSQWADDGVVLCIAQYTGVPGQLGWTHPRAAVHQYTDNAPTPSATKPTDRSSTLGTWTAASLTIGGTPAPRKEIDDMWKFLVDVGTAQADGSYTRCAELLPTGELIGTTWADVNAKVTEFKAGGAPASVRGVETAVFDDYVANSNAHKAATANLAKLTGIGVTAAVPTSLVFDLAVTGSATPKSS